jgi:RNA polymerase sigma factor (sigma-70 family)
MTMLEQPSQTAEPLWPPVPGYHQQVPMTLEERFVSGDEAALRAIYDEHASLVLNICRRTVGADAEDVVQQVFVAAWRGRSSFDATKGSLAGWLTGIAKFKAIDHLRAKGRRPQSADQEVEDSASTAADVGRVADRMLLTRALSTLPEERRRVVALAFFEDFTHQEISEHLAMPLGTVKSHVRRGLETLRHVLDSQAIGEIR